MYKIIFILIDCRALIHVIDGTSQDPLGDFLVINQELFLFNEKRSIQ